MEDLLESIRELKSDAKYDRDRGRYDSAIDCLSGKEGAIPQLEKGLSSKPSPEWKGQLGSELADCFGLLGGILRRRALEPGDPDRAAHLLASVRAYEQGYTTELDPDLHIVNSYNMVNRLISYILLDPDSLTRAPREAATPDRIVYDIPKELTAAETTIQQQLRGARRGDIWAMADLAMIRILLDKEPPELAYADLNAQSPPDYAYDSILSTLVPLAELPLPVQPKLEEAVVLLESRRKKLMR